MVDHSFSGVRIQDLVLTDSAGSPLPSPFDDNLVAFDRISDVPTGWELTIPVGTSSTFTVVDDAGDTGISGDTIQEVSDDTTQQTINGERVFYESTFTLTDGTNNYVLHLIEVSTTADDYSGGANSWFFFDDPAPPEGIPLTLVGISNNNPNELNYVCFVDGTTIETTVGAVKVEDLSVGDEVIQADGRPVKVRWIGSHQVHLSDGLANQKLWPVKIAKNALGSGIPNCDLFVSQQHRILVKSKIVKRMFDEDEVLVPAKLLAQSLPGCSIVRLARSFSYLHFACDEHEIVRANGAHAESLYLGEQAEKILGEEQCRELEMIFPNAFPSSGNPPMKGARSFAIGKQARKLLQRHKQNKKPIYAE